MWNYKQMDDDNGNDKQLGMTNNVELQTMWNNNEVWQTMCNDSQMGMTNNGKLQAMVNSKWQAIGKIYLLEDRFDNWIISRKFIHHYTCIK